MNIQVNLSREDNPIEQIQESLELLYKIENAFMKREEINLDFSEVEWILPCSAILISSKVIDIKEQGAKINYIESKNKKVKEYLADIGFPFGKKSDGETFVAIKHFAKNAGDKNQVNRETNELLEKIQDKIPEQFGGSVLHIFGELSANIDDHSQFTFASLMAQYYPKKEYLDIAVFDNGITIPLLFEKNNLHFKKDSEAMKEALSGKSTKEEDLRGHGLISCKRLTTEGINGELYIISRKGAIFINSKEAKENNFDKTPLKGTFLYFRLKTPKKKVNIYEYV